MKKILLNLTAIFVFTQLTYATQLPDAGYKEEPDILPPTQVVDVNKWVERYGVSEMFSGSDNLSSFELNLYIGRTLREYSPDHLQIVMDQLEATGLWKKITEVGSSTSVKSLMEIMRDYPLGILEPSMAWVVDKDAIGKCHTHYDVNNLLIFLKEGYSQERFYKQFFLIEETGLWKKCKEIKTFISLCAIVDEGLGGEIKDKVKLLQDSGLLDRWNGGNELVDVLNLLSNYEPQLFISDMTWVKEAGVWDARRMHKHSVSAEPEERLPRVSKICDLLSILKGCTLIQRRIILPWMRDNQIMDKCENVYDFNQNLKELCKKSDVEKIAPALAWVKDSGALQGVKRGSSRYLLSTVLSFPTDRLSSTEKWMKESGVWSMCAASGTLASLLVVVKGYFVEKNDRSDVRLHALVNWMKESGLLSKCDGKTVYMVIERIYPISLVNLFKVEVWLKKLGVWDASNGYELSHKIDGMKPSLSKPFWVQKLDDLICQYDLWCDTPSGSTIRAFILESL